MGGGPTKALCGVGDPGTDMRKMAQRGLPSRVVEKEYVNVSVTVRWRRAETGGDQDKTLEHVSYIDA